jgi:hypothetical protein
VETGPIVDPGILAPIRITPGLRVLVVDSGRGELARSLARSGATVVALEERLELFEAARAADPSADVTLWPDSLGYWLSQADHQERRFDVVVLLAAHRPPATRGLARGLEGDVDAATVLLQPGGLVFIVVRNHEPVGPPTFDLDVAGDADRAGQPDAPMRRHRAMLDMRGLPAQRWFLAHPDADAPVLVVSEHELARPSTRAVLRAVSPIVPGGALGRGGPPRLDELLSAALDRRAVDRGEVLVVAASGTAEGLSAHLRAGVAWVWPRRAAGSLVHELVLEGEGHSMRPPGGADLEVRRGPLLIRERLETVPEGLNGESVLAAAVEAEGPSGPTTQRSVREWWAAANRLQVVGNVRHSPLDVGPAGFVVAPDGGWEPFGQQTMTWWPLPPVLLALHGLVPSVASWAAAGMRLRDRSRSTTVSEVVRAMLEPLGLPVGDGSFLLYIDLEGDLRARLGRADGPPDQTRSSIRADLTLTFVPALDAVADEVARLAGTVQDLTLAAAKLEDRQRAVERDLATLSERSEHEHAATESLAATLERLTIDVTNQEAGIESLRAGSAHREDELAGLRAESKRQDDELAAMRAAIADLRAEVDRLGWRPPIEPGRLRRSSRALRARLSEPAAFAAVEASGFLDRAWYRTTYPDVARSSVDPVLHYLRQGWREGRDPGPRFATRYYLEANPDVARAGINPLVHYIRAGQREGRAPMGGGLEAEGQTGPEP